MDASTPIQNPLIRKLASIVVLSDDERAALLGIPATVRNVGADEEIVHEGDHPSECCLIVEGFTCRYTMTEDGKRQIFSFHIPGDIPDLQSLHLEVMDHSLGTLVPSKLAFISHATIRDLVRRCPRIADAFWRDTLIDAAVFREWMVGLGRRDAYERIAHLLCELFVRLKAVGLTSGHAYKLPLTQAELGDALGLSTVHVNRTLQQLRGDGLIQTQGGMVLVQDWERLKQAGQFDETYLHLRKEAA
jgi:CRP-like cAMP-binding protein